MNKLAYELGYKSAGYFTNPVSVGSGVLGAGLGAGIGAIGAGKGKRLRGAAKGALIGGGTGYGASLGLLPGAATGGVVGGAIGAGREPGSIDMLADAIVRDKEVDPEALAMAAAKLLGSTGIGAGIGAGVGAGAGLGLGGTAGGLTGAGLFKLLSALKRDKPQDEPEKKAGLEVAPEALATPKKKRSLLPYLLGGAALAGGGALAYQNRDALKRFLGIGKDKALAEARTLGTKPNDALRMIGGASKAKAIADLEASAGTGENAMLAKLLQSARLGKDITTGAGIGPVVPSPR